MKKRILVSVLLILAMILCSVSCNKVPKEGLWEDATYRRDTNLGEGDVEFYVEVKAGDESVTFTIRTDKQMLGAALLEHELIAGEESQYGLYVKVVNGITADYDKDGHYWSLEQNGEMLMTGVDSTPIVNGAHYEFVYK